MPRRISVVDWIYFNLSWNVLNDIQQKNWQVHQALSLPIYLVL